MNRKQTLIQLACAMVLGSSLMAADVIYDFTPNTTITDGSAVGIANNQSFISGLTNISDVNVALTINGPYAGDLYSYLTHSSSTAVLLNRPGRDTGLPYGYSGGGLNIRLDDSASLDIHTYGGGANGTNGTWLPDGRATDPSVVATGDARTLLLNQLNTPGSADGTWTLFAADLAGGGTHTLAAWSLELTAQATGGETRVASGYGYRVMTDGALAGNWLNVLAGGKATFEAANGTIGSLSGAGNVLINGSSLTAGTDGSSTLFSGSLLGVGTFIKQGAGVLTLSGNSTNGGIYVRAGTLLLNGLANSGVTVETNGTFGGSGTVLGNLTVDLGGIHSPGSSPAIQTVIGSYLNNGNLTIDLNGLVAGTDYDQVDVTGSVELGANSSLLLALGFSPNQGDSFIIINNDGIDTVIGNFQGLLDDSYFAQGGYTFQISYDSGTGNDVVLTVVPEASTWTLMLLGGFGLVVMTRRWKKA